VPVYAEEMAKNNRGEVIYQDEFTRTLMR
jgi:hypothetical protein